jgi:hypothetical protein
MRREHSDIAVVSGRANSHAPKNAVWAYWPRYGYDNLYSLSLHIELHPLAETRAGRAFAKAILARAERIGQGDPSNGGVPK